MHTSMANIVVMKEIEQASLKIEDKDLRFDTFRSSGKGGQHVNVTDSAVRVTHVPTGIVAQSQSERSQHKNKQNAMAVLITRLFELSESERKNKLSFERRSQMNGAGLRKIRTYNFPNNRVTDHVTGGSFVLDRLMKGEA